MATLTITADIIDDLEEYLEDHEGPIAVAFEELDWESLNGVRFLLGDFELDEPAEIDGDPTTIDELLGVIVEHLGRSKPGMRLRDPETMSEAEWAAVRARYRPAGDFLYYIDGEEDPYDSGRLYDAFEGYLFPDEDW